MNTKDPEGNGRHKRGDIPLIMQVFGVEEEMGGKIEPEQAALKPQRADTTLALKYPSGQLCVSSRETKRAAVDHGSSDLGGTISFQAVIGIKPNDQT